MAVPSAPTIKRLVKKDFIVAVYKLGKTVPQIDSSAFVADSAQVMGDVVMQAHSSVWFNVVARGDVERITIGEGSNVQDGSVLHADHGVPLTIGKHVTVGHQVMLHGCTIGDGSLIGIQAVVLNRAVIGKNCLVGAGAIVTEGKEFPDNSLILGAPAKVVRVMTDEQIKQMQLGAGHYVKNAERFKQELVRIDTNAIKESA
jgi:carbonic anhydrase/acetyltransferase-like protein (isoleucine patch superfamily)